ncbi:MAG: DUF4159 domain-containing protein [Candidatus Kapabacteria bacterium]|nr:DUF4159 domain-containing protein [Ignavibacteriota bacterium]MCW5885523.1 DUF4159 domain-containing protein [Candidatus Kapabacteria bacterium]
MANIKYIFLATVIISIFSFEALSQIQGSAIKLGRVKYSGGGDWYNDPSSEPQLLTFVKKNTNINVESAYEFVDLGTDNIFYYPILFLTGHGNVNFTDSEVRRLRAYLENGGFLYIDDDYGLDQYIRREMKKVFPNQEFIEIPYSHGLFNSPYPFPNGAPKVHEHDEKPPQTFGLFHEGRLCVLYTYESNPSDGWPEPDVHKVEPDKRLQALKFGTNIIVWALSN